MGRKRIRTAVLALAVLAALPLVTPRAADFTPTRLVESHRDSGTISPDQAAAIARQATGGRVLGVDRRGDGRPWYRVKVLVNGQRVRYVAVDARNGRIRD